MWDLIWTIVFMLFVLRVQMDVLLMYHAVTMMEEEARNENYGVLESFPEVADFYCPTCHRRFSTYDHCHRHAAARNHNISSLYCKYSTIGLPKCHRSSP